MKRFLLTISALTALFSVSNAQTNLALGQLNSEELSISIPEAPLPDLGGAINFAIKWDDNAPFTYSQNPAAAISGKNGTTTLANVRFGRTPADHKTYSWGTVTVNPELVEKAVYAYKTAGTGHTFLVFTFKDGGAVSDTGENLRAMTFGAEGWSREPQGYDISHALAGKYPLIWLVTTFESYSDYVVNYKQKEIFFKNLAIDREQTKRLFSLLLARIDESNRGKETYNLFHNSCTNNPVNLINQVLPENKRISLKIAGLMNPNASIPKHAVKKFTEKGVLLPETFHVGADNYSTFDITKI